MPTKEYIEMCINEWYRLMDDLRGADMDNVREFFKYLKNELNERNCDITNDTKEYIDANYKHILVTFNAIPNSGYEKYGGKAQLSNVFEIYSEDGIFLGVYDNCGNQIR